jgi:hypothetical protein
VRVKEQFGFRERKLPWGGNSEGVHAEGPLESIHVTAARDADNDRLIVLILEDEHEIVYILFILMFYMLP